MTLSSDDSTAANAAISSLQAAMATHDATNDPLAKANYSAGTLQPLNAASRGLAATLGAELLEAQQTAADSFLTPYVPGQFRRTQLIGEFDSILQLNGWLRCLKQMGGSTDDARNVAGVIVSLLQTVIASAS